VLPATLFSLPIFWREAELAWLRGSLFAEEVAELRAELRAEYAALCALLGGEENGERGGDGEEGGGEKEVEAAVGAAAGAAAGAAPGGGGPGAFGGAVSEGRYLWARSIVQSRNFGIKIGGVKTQSLCPFADMFNHCDPGSAGENAVFGYDEEAGALRITATRPIRRGEQVCFSYGAKPNRRLLKHYGFALEEEGRGGCCVEELTVRFSATAALGHVAAQACLVHGAEEGEAALAVALGGTLGQSGCELVGKLRAKRMLLGEAARSEVTLQTLANLRVLAADEAELRCLVGAAAAAAEGDDRKRLGMVPCSLRNEVAMLRVLRAQMLARLGGYPRTLAEDLGALAGGDAAASPFSNRRHALILLRGEKRLASFYAAFATACLGVLEAGNEAARRAAADALGEQGDDDDDDDDDDDALLAAHMHVSRREVRRLGGGAWAAAPPSRPMPSSEQRC
jgi:histone-lysine N-methyltransferase SETD3